MVDWYKKAAEQGFADTHYNLGMMYNEGEGVPKDQGKALGWYQKAADQGDVEAQFLLDLWYNENLGAWKNNAKETELFHKDAGQGDEAAIEMIDILEQQGSSVQAKKIKPGLLKRLFR
jgi:TPR repeat protein